jgi:hypothetical protein
MTSLSEGTFDMTDLTAAVDGVEIKGRPGSLRERIGGCGAG